MFLYTKKQKNKKNKKQKNKNKTKTKTYTLWIACLIFKIVYIIFSFILFLVIKFLIHHFKILTYFQEKQTKNKNNAEHMQVNQYI